MPSTFAHAVFPAGAVWLARLGFPSLTRKEFIRLICLATFLGNAPDLDLIPASFFNHQWNVIHRSLGHNLFSVTLLTLVGGYGIRIWVSQKFSKVRAFILALTLISTHLLLDSLAKQGQGHPIGIAFFWPFSDTQYTIPFTVFPRIYPHPNVHPVLGFALSRQFWTEALILEMLRCVLLLGIWAILFHGARMVSRHWKRNSLPVQDGAKTTPTIRLSDPSL